MIDVLHNAGQRWFTSSWWDRATPLDAAGWRAGLVALVGVLLGYATAPTLWFVVDPGTFVAWMWGTMSAESAFRSDAAGDGGTSFGLFQFHVTDPAVGVSETTATSPFRSGVRAAWYLAQVLRGGRWSAPRLSAALYWAPRLALGGYPFVRAAWYGPGLAERELSILEVWQRTDDNPRAWPAYTLGRVATLPVTIAWYLPILAIVAPSLVASLGVAAVRRKRGR